MNTHREMTLRIAKPTILILAVLAILLAPRPSPAQSPQPARAPEAPSEAPPSLPKIDAPTAGRGGGGKPFSDLTNRYRFIEHYTTRDEQADPGMVGQYHVAVKEVLKETVSGPDGPSRPTEVTRQTIFSERPAEMSGMGTVSATIRNYERFQVFPDDVAATGDRRTLDGLTVWCHPQLNELPLIVSLTAGRRLTEREYEVSARQVFMPHLHLLLPPSPVHVGDSWRVARKAVQAMLGEPELRNDAVFGKFLELRRDDDGKTTYAVFNVTGRVATPLAELTVNAQILFGFPTPVPGDPSKAGGLVRTSEESRVEARGAITQFRLARVALGVVPGAKPQSHRSAQELVLERQVGEGKSEPIRLVDAPARTEANTWLTYTDPRNRFAFQHAQDLLPPDRHQFAARPGTDAVFLVKSRPEGRDLVRIELFAKEKTPESLKDILDNQWKQMKVEVLPGNEEWLPEVDWPKMKVFRIEAALKLPSRSARGSRMHYDAYLVQLGGDASLMVVATTTRDAVAGFRRDVEQLIKTFQLGKASAP